MIFLSIILIYRILEETVIGNQIENIHSEQSKNLNLFSNQQNPVFDRINTTKFSEYIWPHIENSNYNCETLVQDHEKVLFVNKTINLYYKIARELMVNKNVIGIILLNDMYDKFRIVKRGIYIHKMNPHELQDPLYVQVCIVYNRLIKINQYISKAEKLFGDPNISYEDLEMIFNKSKDLIANKSDLTFTSLGDLKRLLLHSLYIMAMYFEDFETNNTFIWDSTNLSNELLMIMRKTDSNIYLKALYYDVLVYAKYLAENGDLLLGKENHGENYNYEHMLYVLHTWLKLTNSYRIFEEG